MRRFLLPFVLASVVCTTVVTAWAQSPLEQARILFDAGVQAYTAGHYAQAVESFREAFALSGKPQAIFSLAQAERRLHLISQDPQHLHSAIEHFRKYLDLVKDGGRRNDAVEALGQLELLAVREVKPLDVNPAAPGALVGKILISTATPGAKISIDGSEVADSPVLEAVSLGKHTVRVSAPGYITEQREIVAIEKTLVPMEIALREQPSYLSLKTREGAAIQIDGRIFGEAPIAKKIELRRGPHTVAATLPGYYPWRETIVFEPGQTNSVLISLQRTRQRVASYVLLGAAGAGLIAAGIQGVGTLYQHSQAQAILARTQQGNISQEQLDTYNDAVRADGSLEATTFVTLIGAGVLGIAGGVLYVFDSSASRAETAEHDTVGFSFEITPTNAGVGVRGRF